jgi:type I restriction enzyme R subunit
MDYFGDPLYTYSLKQGIDDGFLAPYKVIRVALDVDTFGFRPTEGQVDDRGTEIPDREYTADDIDDSIVFPERDKRVAERVTEYLKKTDRFAKTIVFCQDIPQCRLAYFDHAAVLTFALVRMGLASLMVAGASWRVPCWPGFLTG